MSLEDTVRTPYRAHFSGKALPTLLWLVASTGVSERGVFNAISAVLMAISSVVFPPLRGGGTCHETCW
jgi:hypothetical protein